jgi:hypothetical protein
MTPNREQIDTSLPSVLGRKQISETQMGTLSCNQSCATFFAWKTATFFSTSHNFRLFSLPPVPKMERLSSHHLVLSSFPSVSIVDSSKDARFHNLTTPDSTLPITTSPFFEMEFICPSPKSHWRIFSNFPATQSYVCIVLFRRPNNIRVCSSSNHDMQVMPSPF